MVVSVYTTSIIANPSIRKQQWEVIQFLKANSIEFEEIDLSVHTEARPVMLKRMPESARKDAFPPQIFNEDEYCGNYESFFSANEMGVPFTFFKLDPPTGSREVVLLEKYAKQGIEMKFC